MARVARRPATPGVEREAQCVGASGPRRSTRIPVRGRGVPDMSAAKAEMTERASAGPLLSCVFCMLALLFGLLVAQPLRVHYPDNATSVARERVVRQRDRGFVRGTYPYLGDDDASYFAMAEHPLGDGYLERRSPFCFRLLEPLLARLLTILGLDAPAAFLLIGIVGWLLAGLAVVSLAQFFGARPLTAAAVGAVFMMTPATLDGLVYPHIIDAGAWALMFWSWDRWVRGRTTLAAVLLLAAVLWRETSALLLLCMLAQGMRNPRARRDIALVTGAVVAGLLLPRLLVNPSQSFPVTLVIHRVLHSRASDLATLAGVERVVLAYTVDGLGFAAFVLLAPRRARARQPVAAAALLLPAGVVVSLAAFNVGRLLVPATLAILLWACPLFDSLDGRRRGLTLSVLAIVTAAYDIPYARNRASPILAAAAICLLAGVVRWPSAIDSRTGQSLPAEGAS
jgi:hypothetical protein